MGRLQRNMQHYRIKNFVMQPEKVRLTPSFLRGLTKSPCARPKKKKKRKRRRRQSLTKRRGRGCYEAALHIIACIKHLPLTATEFLSKYLGQYFSPFLSLKNHPLVTLRTSLSFITASSHIPSGIPLLLLYQLDIYLSYQSPI